MANRLYILFVFAAMTIAALAMPGPLREQFVGLHSNNIDISISEDEETITLRAIYPKDRAASVHQYIKDQFGLNDQINLSAADVKQYHTPDSSMHFHIKSRDGYLKIAMSRPENSRAAYEKVKEASKGIQRVLAGH